MANSNGPPPAAPEGKEDAVARLKTASANHDRLLLLLERLHERQHGAHAGLTPTPRHRQRATASACTPPPMVQRSLTLRQEPAPHRSAPSSGPPVMSSPIPHTSRRPTAASSLPFARSPASRPPRLPPSSTSASPTHQCRASAFPDTHSSELKHIGSLELKFSACSVETTKKAPDKLSKTAARFSKATWLRSSVTRC